MSPVNLVDFGRPADHELSKPVNDMLLLKYRRTPRNLQKELGPSEIGEPCSRKLALKIMNEPELHEGDPLPSIVGTAAHSWMEEACRKWNEHVGRVDWIPELAVEIVPGIIGHSDAYHVPTNTVVDWKFPGTESMKDKRKNGPGELYRVQAHTYGKGWRQLGLPVRQVAIIFLPRGGMLFGKYGKYIWSEPFDESIADRAIQRYYDITEQAMMLDVENNPIRYKAFPTERGHSCTYCPFFKPGEDKGNSCPGWTEDSKPL